MFTLDDIFHVQRPHTVCVCFMYFIAVNKVVAVVVIVGFTLFPDLLA